MNKIRIKMAEVAHVDSVEEGRKKRGLYKGMKKIFGKILSPAKDEHNPEQHPVQQEEENIEITAFSIEQSIDTKEFRDASKGLIVLENKIFNDDDEKAPLQEAELDSLYKKLKAEVFRVIKDFSNTDRDLLRQAVQVIVDQEAQDSKCASDLGKSSKLRPMRWKKAWEEECVRDSVESRLESEYSSGVVQTLTEFGKMFKDDLLYLNECYPEEFDVCNVYACHYHAFIEEQIKFLLEFELTKEDTYFILSWVHDIYPRRILKHPGLAEHIDESRLKSLLSPETIRQHENHYLNYETHSVTTHMNKALDWQVDMWNRGTEPRLLGNFYHSELHIDIIQRYDSALKTTAEIRPEMADKMAPYLDHILEDFMRRYKKVFGEFLEKNKTQEHYKAICIAHLNCCQSFREFITSKDTKMKASTQRELLSIVEAFEETAYEILLQDLFADLKTQFSRMSQGNAPFSYQTMMDIIRKTSDFVSPFSTLCPACYKNMMKKIHLYLVKTLLGRILKKKVTHKNMQQLQTLANQIKENALLIEEFFTSHSSEEDWLKDAIPTVAEIIRLQDLNALQLEVATLVQAYPDIKNKQIEAILYIKGNLSKHEVRSIIRTAETIERSTANNPKLFASIKT